MTDNPEHVPVEETELVEADQDADTAEGEFIEQPAKVMRVGSMLRQLLDELKEVTLDEGSRDRMREIPSSSPLCMEKTMKAACCNGTAPSCLLYTSDAADE